MPMCGNCKQQHETVDEVRKCYNQEAVADVATDKQVEFIKSLAAEREVSGLSRVVESIRKTYDEFILGNPISKADASKLINGLLGCDKRPEPAEDRWPDVPAGRYALESEADGHVFFVQVSRPTEGKWVGWVFAAYLVGSPGDYTRNKPHRIKQRELLDRIQADPVAAARLFGDKTATCGRCCSPLSNPQSRAAGFGETCARKSNWPYPSRSEALRMLDERGVKLLTEEEARQLELSITDGMDEVVPEAGLEPGWTI